MTRLFFLSHYQSLHGANRSLLGLLAGLDKKHFHAIVATPKRGPLSEEVESLGFETTTMPFKYAFLQLRKIQVFRRGLGRFRAKRRLMKERQRENEDALRKLKEVAVSWQPDLIYTNTRVLTVGADLAAEMKLPHVWHMREFGKEDFGLIPVEGQRRLNKKVLQSDAVIAVSKAVARSLPRKLKKDSLSVIYNGVLFHDEIQTWASTSYSPVENTVCKFILVGRIEKNKGQTMAIEALGRVIQAGNSASLDIVGDGPREGLQKRSAELGISGHVTFHGYQDNPLPLVKNSDVALMCSPNEAMGRVTAEAMCLGKPVIGYNGGATPELIKHEGTGLLFDGTVADLAKQMMRLIDDRNLCQSLGAAALKESLDRFTIEKYASQIQAVIKMVLSKRKEPHET